MLQWISIAFNDFQLSYNNGDMFMQIFSNGIWHIPEKTFTQHTINWAATLRKINTKMLQNKNLAFQAKPWSQSFKSTITIVWICNLFNANHWSILCKFTISICETMITIIRIYNHYHVNQHCILWQTVISIVCCHSRMELSDINCYQAEG